MSILEVNGLNKKIKGNVILNNINLSVESGNVYGFVGRNGSGKTMLFRAIAGLIKGDSGYIDYDGKRLHKDIHMLPNLGVIIENIGLYPEFTGKRNLKFLADINKKISDEEIDAAITRVGLDCNDKRKVKKYSLGMKQRIVIAQAIMEKPEILLLDEPTNALDKDGVKLMRKIILEEKERGAIVLIASHNQEDINRLCDKVYYIEAGVLRDKREEADE